MPANLVSLGAYLSVALGDTLPGFETGCADRTVKDPPGGTDNPIAADLPRCNNARYVVAHDDGI